MRKARFLKGLTEEDFAFPWEDGNLKRAASLERAALSAPPSDKALSFSPPRESVTSESFSILYGTSHKDQLSGRSSTQGEILRGLAGNDTFLSGVGLEIYDGGRGIDTVSYMRERAGVHASLAHSPLINGRSIFRSIENLTGSNYDDYLEGNNGTNRLQGGRGNDTLVGGNGADRLEGGEGDDVLISSNAAHNQFEGGEGHDIVRLTGRGQILDLNIAPSRLRGIEEIDLGGNRLNISASAIAHINDTHELIIDHGALSVRDATDWHLGGFRMIDGQSYRFYQNAGASTNLLLGNDLTHSLGNVIDLGHAINVQRIDGVPLPNAAGRPPIQIRNDDPDPQGANYIAQTGYAVSSAGDFNGDGFDDIMVSAPSAYRYFSPTEYLDGAGAVYILYGSATGIHLPDLSQPLGADGIRIFGGHAGATAGFSITSVGDLNGDGINDVLIGVPVDNHGDGGAYVVYGHQGGYAPNTDIDLGNLTHEQGFRILGAHLPGQTGQYSGFPEAGSSVASAGDINGDGVNDFLIGAPFTDIQTPGGVIADAGAAYLIYGNRNGYANDILDLTDFHSPSFDGNLGVRILGLARNERAGLGLTGLGDINGDGFADIAITTPNSTHNGADPSNTALRTGSTYVLFGNGHGFGENGTLDLAHLQPNQGVRIDGLPSSLGTNVVGGRLGESIAAIGDVNGDGLDDFIVGADRQEDPTTHEIEVGGAYILYGSRNFGAEPILSLSDLTPDRGVHLVGNLPRDRVGFSVSSAGDFNHDGIADLIVGSVWVGVTPTSNNNGISAGASYVIYGRQGGIGQNGSLNLGDLLPDQGFEIRGAHGGDQAGIVSRAGDVNHDGYDDLLIGAYSTSYNGTGAGSAYILYGGGFVPPQHSADTP